MLPKESAFSQKRSFETTSPGARSQCELAASNKRLNPGIILLKKGHATIGMPSFDVDARKVGVYYSSSSISPSSGKCICAIAFADRAM